MHVSAWDTTTQPTAPAVPAASARTVPAWLIDGRYRVLGTLGSGGMAQVVRARDEVLQREVAIKVFDAQLAPDAGRRSLLEMSTLANLNHPNIVAAFDAGLEYRASGRSVPYLVSELVDGPTLAQQIALGPLDPVEVAQLGIQLGTALGYIHGRGVVHRDIKPANVLLAASISSQPWTAKLADFGIVRILGGDDLTATGFMVGTVAYLSPEQVRGGAAGPASDIYSLGLVLLEALTGSRAFPGNGVDVALARLHRRPAIPDDLGPVWHGVLDAMTADDPAARPSAHDLTGALARLASADTDPELGALSMLLATSFHTAERHRTPRRVEAAPLSRRPRRPWLVAAACLLGVIAALGTIWAARTAIPSHPAPIDTRSSPGASASAARRAITGPPTVASPSAGATPRVLPGVAPPTGHPSTSRSLPGARATAIVSTPGTTATSAAAAHGKPKKSPPQHGKKSPH